MSRTWNPEPLKDGSIRLRPSDYGGRTVVMVNPCAKKWSKHSYVLWFGGCGATYLHVYNNTLDEALDDCAEWLLEHAPGHVMLRESKEYHDIVKEACEDAGVTFDPDLFCGSISAEAAKILESAEADLTQTDMGFLTSYEWGISLEDPDVATLYAFIQGT